MPKPIIIYITGADRSGSSFLEGALGDKLSAFPQGEVWQLLERGILDGERCTCRSWLPECSFWGPLIKNVSEQFSLSHIEKLNVVRKREIRTRQFIRSCYHGFNEEPYEELVQFIGQAYQYAASKSGARVLIDNSKNPLYANLMIKNGWDVRVVHLVRDPRGVCYSLSKIKQRPEASRRSRKKYMDRLSLLGGIKLWTVANLMAWLLHRKNDYYVMVKYEDLMHDSEGHLERISAQLGLEHILGGNECFGMHSISGNPARFSEEINAPRSDTGWRKGLPLSKKIAVSILTLPVHLLLSRISK